MSVLDEFVERTGVLRDVQFGEVSGRLARLVDWMETQPAISEIMGELRRAADGVALVIQGGFHNPPPANTPDEIAAVGLTLMEACRNEDFANVCLSRGIGPSYSTSAVQPYVDAGLQRYVIPFLLRVERELAEPKANNMLAKIAERKLDEIVMGRTFQAAFPITHQHLTRVAAEFLRSDADAAWQNVGNSCRQAMIEFCNECIPVMNVQLPEGTKRSDVKAIARQLVRASHGTGRFAAALEALIVSIWDYAQPLTHRSESTRNDALRMYLWTGLAIGELGDLILALPAREAQSGESL
jgi:hypothetical protein